MDTECLAGARVEPSKYRIGARRKARGVDLASGTPARCLYRAQVAIVSGSTVGRLCVE